MDEDTSKKAIELISSEARIMIDKDESKKATEPISSEAPIVNVADAAVFDSDSFDVNK
jgi:hypothetical protein